MGEVTKCCFEKKSGETPFNRVSPPSVKALKIDVTEIRCFSSSQFALISIEIYFTASVSLPDPVIIIFIVRNKTRRRVFYSFRNKERSRVGFYSSPPSTKFIPPRVNTYARLLHGLSRRVFKETSPFALFVDYTLIIKS